MEKPLCSSGSMVKWIWLIWFGKNQYEQLTRKQNSKQESLKHEKLNDNLRKTGDLDSTFSWAYASGSLGRVPGAIITSLKLHDQLGKTPKTLIDQMDILKGNVLESFL